MRALVPAVGSEQVTVTYATSGGAATSGTDFTAVSGTLTFVANDTSKVVNVATTDDSDDEENDTFTLTLSSPTNATLGDSTATGTINSPAAAVLLGEGDLSEAQLVALDRLGNCTGSFDLGDVLSWIDRCRRGEADCGGTTGDAGLVGAAARIPAAEGFGLALATSSNRCFEPRRKFLVAQLSTGDGRHDVCDDQILDRQPIPAPDCQQFYKVDRRALVPVHKAVIGNDAVDKGTRLLVDPAVVAVIGPVDCGLDGRTVEDSRGSGVLTLAALPRASG